MEENKFEALRKAMRRAWEIDCKCPECGNEHHSLLMKSHAEVVAEELLNALTELMAFEEFSIPEKMWRSEYKSLIYKARAVIARAKGEA